MTDRDGSFPDGFFARIDASADEQFYAEPRLVTHLDDAAVAAVGAVYAELGLTGDVLDLCASWVSHFREPPARLVALGLNRVELERNAQATQLLVHDLNARPALPFADPRSMA